MPSIWVELKFDVAKDSVLVLCLNKLKLVYVTFHLDIEYLETAQNMQLGDTLLHWNVSLHYFGDHD